MPRKPKTTKKNNKKKPYNRKKNYKKVKSGFIKLVRWSSKEPGSTNVHLSLIGNDAIFSGNSTTTFTLFDTNAYTELVNLFDNYRITRVLYRWIVSRNPDQATSAGNKGIYPRLVWTHDFNDAISIGRDAIYQRANMKEVYFTDNYQRTRWYSLKPSTLTQVYESSTSTAYSPKWLQWLDTNDSQTPHYGIKYAWDQLFTGINLRLEAKIFIECKGIS